LNTAACAGDAAAINTAQAAAQTHLIAPKRREPRAGGQPQALYDRAVRESLPDRPPDRLYIRAVAVREHENEREQERRSAEEPAPQRPPQHAILALQRGHGNAAVSRWLSRVTAEYEETIHKDDSARFEGDQALADIFAGSKTLKKGARGREVVKLQQALVDAGFKLPKHGVDGKFEGETESAVKAFQGSVGIAPPTGVFDQQTMEQLDALYDTRKPYTDNAAFNPLDPNGGTRKLSADDKSAINQALVPARGVGGGATTFQDDVGGAKYGDEMRAHLQAEIDSLHKDLYEDKEPLRADPKKNFHEWSTLEGPAAGATDVTDAVYGSYIPGAPPPAMSQAAGNFVDQWEDELTVNAGLSDADKLKKARDKVWYLINSNSTAVNEKHSAVPTDPAETAILTPIVETFINDKTKVQRMLDLDIGWEGAQLAGIVYLQRYKQDTDAKNRAQLWGLFHTCIHEYLHSCAHADFQAYALGFKRRGDSTRYNTLIEGFCDFFTENVRTTVAVTPQLKAKVEGPYHDAAAPVPVIDPDVYPSIAQAEQVVSIAGIRNASSAYFRGEVDKIGGP
jgi:hypothetical protein